ncbi:uncharacterized protein PRD47_005921 isoform 1-T1 [Ara ararauna]
MAGLSVPVAATTVEASLVAFITFTSCQRKLWNKTRKQNSRKMIPESVGYQHLVQQRFQLMRLPCQQSCQRNLMEEERKDKPILAGDPSFKFKEIPNICKRNQLANSGPMKLVLMFLRSVKYYGQTDQTGHSGQKKPPSARGHC